MRIFNVLRSNEYSLKKHLLFAYAIGLLGFYYQLHQIFVVQQNEGIPFSMAKGFLCAAMLGFFFYFLSRLFPYLSIWTYFYKGFSLLAHSLLAGITVFCAYTLYANSQYLFNISQLWNGFIFFIGYLAFSLLLTFLHRPTSNYAFVKASMISFLVVSLYIFIKVNILSGVVIAFIYLLYLICLGRFIVDLINNLFGFQINSRLESGTVAFIFGILGNYLIWYCLGQLALLFPLTAVCYVILILMGGFLIYWSAFRRFLVQLYREWSIHRAVDLPSAVLLNIILYCMILMFVVIGIKVPGHIDSSMLMYGATIYKFAALHRIVFLPFYHHWPLIFQPLLFEVTGLPIYLMGDISAWRVFNVMCFFSFFPFIIMLRRSYNLSLRTIILVLFLYVSSSFTFNMAYSDKPEVLAFPAFLSLLSICLLLLRETKPWYFLAVGGLASIVYNTKPVLIFGGLVTVFLLFAGFLIKKPESSASGNKKAVLISIGIFVFICSIHVVQNLALRGNPFHPFGSKIFKASNHYPEEIQYTHTPKLYYKRTIPINMPSLISGINLDSARGMYRPLVEAKYPSGHATYWHTRYSINIVITMVFVTLPILLLMNSDRLFLFCSLVAMLSFFIWFGWIGDGLRYSTYFPAIALFTAVYCGGRSLSNIYFDQSWRYLIYCILIFSVPFAVASTFEKKETAKVFDFIFRGQKIPESIRPQHHPVTSYLNRHKKRTPILLVSDMRISQYGFYQPNFLFEPYFSSQSINMVYISRIKPTHLLTSKFLDESLLTQKYPNLRAYLILEKLFTLSNDILKLYRFSSDTPWDQFFAEYEDRELFSQGLLTEVAKFSKDRRSGDDLNKQVLGIAQVTKSEGQLFETNVSQKATFQAVDISNLNIQGVPKAQFIAKLKLPQSYVDHQKNIPLVVTDSPAALFYDEGKQPMIPVSVSDGQKLLLVGIGSFADRSISGLPLIYYGNRWYVAEIELIPVNSNPGFLPDKEGLTIPGWRFRSTVSDFKEFIAISHAKEGHDEFTRIQIRADQRLALLPKLDLSKLKDKPVTIILKSRTKKPAKLIMSAIKPQSKFMSITNGEKWQTYTLIGWISDDLQPYLSIEFGKIKNGDYIDLISCTILIGNYPLSELKSCGIDTSKQ